MQQRQYQNPYQRSGAKSYKAADYSAGFDRRDAWLKRGESEYLQSMERNADIELQNAKQENALQSLGKFAEPLAKFSKTLQKRAEAEAKEREAQSQADAEVAALMSYDNDATPDADSMEQLAEKESLVTNNYEQNTGDAAGATYMRTEMGQASGTAAFGTQRMTMQQARGMYAGSLSSYLGSNQMVTINGQQMPVSVAVQNPANIGAVVNGYIPQFLRQAGLTNLDAKGRQELAKTLAGTIWQTNGQMIGSLTGAATKATREQALTEVSGRVFATGRSGLVSPEQAFREASSAFLGSNAGLNQTTANEKAVDTLLDSYIAKGDTDSIRMLAGVQQVPGRAGTELWTVYGSKFDEALVKAATRDNKLDTIALREAKEQMNRELSGVNDPGDRTRILEQYASQLEADGYYTQAAELRGTAQANSNSGQAAINEIILRDSIRDGGDVTQEDLEKARNQGDITEKGYESLTEILKPVDMTKNETYKDVRKGELKSLKTKLMTTWGLKRDLMGNTIPSIDKPLVAPADADAILARLEMDWDKAMSTALTRSGAEGPTEIAEQLTEMSKIWEKDNLMTKGGKYDISEIYGKSAADEGQYDARKAASDRFKDLNTVEGLNSNARNRSLAPYVTPRDYSTSYDIGQSIPDFIKNEFRPGRKDKLFPEDTTRSLLDGWQSGKVPESLRKTAQGLGISELELLNSQARAYGMDPIAPTLVQGTSGTTQLIGSGVPSRNAARLMSITDTQQQALDILGKYESPNNGYNAVNQIGYAAGRGAQGSGSYRAIGGRDLTAVSVGEIMSLQEARPGLSNQQWMAQGRLHAVGRYQFTRDTFKEYVQKLGIDPSQPFTPEIQDQMALALMKDRGIQPWIGPQDKATAAERGIIRSATDELRSRQARAIINNPYATGRQLSRSHSYLQNSTTGPQLSASSTVPYVDQRTAVNGAGDRQCFSASATMLANAFGVTVSYDKYNDIRSRYGDTTDPNAQIRALKELGIDASVQDNGSLNEVATSVSSGKPVAIGIMHTPGGSGHWIVVTGVTPNGDFIVHDPFGKLVQRRGGGWAYANSGGQQHGRNAVYSRDFMYSIFEDRGPGTGRIMRVA